MSRLCNAFVSVALLGGALAIGTPAAAAPRPPDVPPPSQRVYVVSDSVGLGARGAIPGSVPARLAGHRRRDAGAVRRATVEQARPHGEATTPSVFGDYAVVAGGYNYPYWDPARFDRSIDAMVDNLVTHGVRHVFWVTLREVKQQYVTAGAWKQVQPYFWYFPTVNAHLRAALDRHPQLSLVDWASVADRPGLTYDAIHLNSFGAHEYANLLADTVLTADKRLGTSTSPRSRSPVSAACRPMRRPWR